MQSVSLSQPVWRVSRFVAVRAVGHFAGRTYRLPEKLRFAATNKGAAASPAILTHRRSRWSRLARLCLCSVKGVGPVTSGLRKQLEAALSYDFADRHFRP